MSRDLQTLRHASRHWKDNDTWADTDISGESTEVQAIANAVWTDAIKTAYQQMIDAQEI